MHLKQDVESEIAAQVDILSAGELTEETNAKRAAGSFAGANAQLQYPKLLAEDGRGSNEECFSKSLLQF
jgi:hypothetical protein